MILVIEDNAPNLELMTYLLGAFGHETRSATSGEEGLLLAAQERPDLILCDVHLPGMDGCEVARRVKADPSLSGVPLIAVTALAMVGDRERVLSAGFDSYIPKPISPESFVPQIEAFLAEQAARPTRPRVLVVDNTPVNLEFAACLLVPHGFEVQTASGLAEALELARTFQPDLILSDVHMGGQGGQGLDLVRAVGEDEELRAIPVLLITSTHDDPRERDRALRLGAIEYLFRPIEASVLLEQVRSCVEQRRKSGQSPGRR